MATMTKKWLKQHCIEKKLYRSPPLNDKLYLHFQGFMEIDNLEEYTGLVALFLEGNAIESLAPLEHNTMLRCLYAQQNCITEIDLPSSLTELATLNLSNNNISQLENLGQLTSLHTLQLANNRLKSVEAVSHLKDCPSIGVLDLSNNHIEDGEPEELLEIFKSMPNLGVLYMQGNPIVSRFSFYRKTLISNLPKLGYLDDRPVFENERLCAEAWKRGGLEEERAERGRISQRKADDDERQANFMREMRLKGESKQKEIWEQRKQLLAQHGIHIENLDEDVECSEPDEDEPEPFELVAARKKLAEYSARPGEEEPPELTAARKDVTSKGKSRQGAWQPITGSDVEGKENDSASAPQFAQPEVVDAFLTAHAKVPSITEINARVQNMETSAAIPQSHDKEEDEDIESIPLTKTISESTPLKQNKIQEIDDSSSGTKWAHKRQDEEVQSLQTHSVELCNEDELDELD
ncbi:Leucine-rich repeat-containing protein oda7 [Cymbomonas tetramitiformis]|uniref:Leucine-rich repeat-containing protein oda7 n=1 Tax=Cymbomonas tetramitiformis TaxID=36881 RepID=A0AAE0GGH6_9CHLO|nr:Leucine-rich repeat-containing protein oda7 [Cymbomonas tetramitiformis]